jgi:glutathione S-transferase
MTQPVLWQFRYSHFNEKVRWALDFKRIQHKRRSVLPGPHAPRMLWLTGQKAVPVLVLDGKPMADSTRIIEAVEQRWPDPPLYPREEPARRRAVEIEAFFDEELGPHLRRAWFFELLHDPAYCAAQLSAGAAPIAQRVFRLAFPMISAVMKMNMKIDAAGAEIGRAKILAALDRVEAELQPSGYLVGDHFTVADLTAAALFSPVVMPPEFPYPLLTPLPAPAARLRDSLAQRRGFLWAADIYRRHRDATMECTEA